MMEQLLVLAWRPFLEPIPITQPWLLLVPLVVVVALIYKTLKMDHLDNLWRQTAWLAMQILAFMILAAVAIWLAVELV